LGDKASTLLDYMSEEDRTACEPLIKLYLAEENRDQAMDLLIRHMVAAEQFSSIAEVHPAWILEHLREEPPRVVGIILRYLPSKHLRFLLKNLPPHIRERIPGMVESFAVPGPILEVIRQRLERHFLHMRICRSEERFGFEHLSYLKAEELETLIRDLGICELAIVFSGLSGKAMRTVYNRLDIKEARRLQSRMKELSDVSPQLFRQARNALLEIEGEHLGPQRMLTRLGLAALASAVGQECERVIRLIQQKLSPHDGYLLKRLANEMKPRGDGGVATERRDIILGLVASLAREERIDSVWSRFESSDISSPAATPAVAKEETQTAQQLA
jgi:flagellar motor switch protein FliG